MDRRVDVKINGTHLSKDSNRAGVRGEANVTYLRITFDDGWNGYAKHVTFWNAKGKNPVTIPLTADMLENIANSTLVYLCPIPGEALTEGGLCTFIIDGYTDGKRQRSVSDELEVIPAPLTEGSADAQDPTPTEAERLQAQIDSILDTIANEVTGASAHAANAAASETAAGTSAAAAATSEGNAAEYARQAQESADDALASENAAAGHAAAAQAWVEGLKVEYIRNITPETVGYATLLEYIASRYDEHPVIFGYIAGFSDLPPGISGGQGTINLCGGILSVQIETPSWFYKRTTISLTAWTGAWRIFYDTSNGPQNGNGVLADGTDISTMSGKNGWYTLSANYTYGNNAPGADGMWGVLEIQDKSATLQVLNGYRFYSSNLDVSQVAWSMNYDSSNLTLLRDALKAIW